MARPFDIVSAPTELDPRRARSRDRLIDAAAHLLVHGGVQAVTVDAVTKLSKVARTTLYRNFGNSTGLLAATLERLVPRVEPTGDGDTLREQLADLLTRQAALIDRAPTQLTLLAWLGITSTDNELHSVRSQIIDRYREPYDRILTGTRARAQLGDIDSTYVISQFIGPVIFMRLTGIRPITAADCRHIVDDFLAANAT